MARGERQIEQMRAAAGGVLRVCLKDPPSLSCVYEQEDTFLRTTYPTYAKDKSVYALLACNDVLEANNRTEHQIRRRIKKLGLLGKNDSENLHDSDSGGEAPRPASEGTLLPEVQEIQPFAPREISEPVNSGGETDSNERAASQVKLSLRRINRKQQVRGDDSDDMFSSPEVSSHALRSDVLSQCPLRHLGWMSQKRVGLTTRT